MKSSMIELPPNRNPNTNNNTTKTTNPSVPAPDRAPAYMVMSPDNTSSTISKYLPFEYWPSMANDDDKHIPFEDEDSKSAMNGLNTVANPNVKPHDTKISKKVPAESPVDSMKKLSQSFPNSMDIVLALKNTVNLHTSRSAKKCAKKAPRSPARLHSPRRENEETKDLDGKSPMNDNGKSPDVKKVKSLC